MRLHQSRHPALRLLAPAVLALACGPAVAASAPLPALAFTACAAPRSCFVAADRGRRWVVSGDEVRIERAGEDGVSVLRLLGAAPSVALSGCDPLAAAANRYLGADPAGWVEGARFYRAVEARGVYPGIDLVHYAGAAGYEYDLVIAPGGDPQRIVLGFSGGAPRIDATGALAVDLGGGALEQHRPRAYQAIAGTLRPVAVSYVSRGQGGVGFRLGAYDRRHPLVIDPVLRYSTFLGGDDVDNGSALAVGPTGDVYILGLTYSGNFPLAGPSPRPFGGASDVFIARMDVNGNLVYSTYLGGTGGDYAGGIAVDASGNAYVVGDTDSTDFPLIGAAQGSPGGGRDLFVAKLSPTGTLVYSTYLGGNGDDYGYGVAVDALNRAWIAGSTLSSLMPVPLGFQTVNRGGSDGYIARLAANGATVELGSYIGGLDDDDAFAIAVDSANSAYVAGTTSSDTFPVVGGVQMTKGFGEDGFVAQVASGGSLVYSSFLGGNGADEATGIAVTPTGTAYVYGWTGSDDFPRRTPLQAARAGDADLFVSRLAPGGGTLVWSTYLGGTLEDEPGSIRLDSLGFVYLSAWSESLDFPLANAFQGVNRGIFDALAIKLDPNGDHLVYASYLGGSDYDDNYAIAVAADGSAWLTGETDSGNFPVVGSTRTFDGFVDAYVSRIEGCLGDVPPRIANLKMARSAGSITWRWSDDPAAGSYSVLSSLLKWFPSPQLVGSATSGGTGLTLPAPAQPLLFYRVAGVGGCGQGPP